MVHQLLNKTMQKLSANLSKRTPATTPGEGSPRRQANFRGYAILNQATR